MAAAFDSGAFESTAFEVGGGGGASYTMACDTGTYAITGSDAALQAARQIAPAQGVYSLTGNTATLIYTPVGLSMLAAPGAYALTGGASNLVATHRLSADAGTYSITGNAVTDPGTPAAPPTGDGGGAGNLREVKRFAELLSKPTKVEKKKRRKVLETVALDLLPDVPEAKIVAQEIAIKVAAKELQVISRWSPPKAMMPVSMPKPEYDAGEAIRRMVDEWIKNEIIRRELEDEEDIEILLMS